MQNVGFWPKDSCPAGRFCRSPEGWKRYFRADFPDFPKNPGLRNGDWEFQSVLGTVSERKQLSADPGMAPY